MKAERLAIGGLYGCLGAVMLAYSGAASIAPWLWVTLGISNIGIGAVWTWLGYRE